MYCGWLNQWIVHFSWFQFSLLTKCVATIILGATFLLIIIICSSGHVQKLALPRLTCITRCYQTILPKISPHPSHCINVSFAFLPRQWVPFMFNCCCYDRKIMLWHCCFNMDIERFLSCLLCSSGIQVCGCISCSFYLSSEVWLLAIESGALSLCHIFIKLIHFWKKPGSVQSKFILCFQPHLVPWPPSTLLLSKNCQDDGGVMPTST